ncbi:hypothetical protein ES702_05661 [subsurface metagenome]
MTTVKGSKGRKYDVECELFGTRNLVHRLYFGGIFLASTDQRGPDGELSSSLEITIERANKRVDDLGIEIDD